MNTKAEIQTMLAAYTARYPDERAAMEPFVRYVASFDAPALYDRKNFVGHLTAGALIVSRQTGCVLLLKHKQLGKWLQPGGHVEASDASVLDAAFREAREETGIGWSCSRRAAPCCRFRPMRTGITFRPARARARTNIGISTCASFSCSTAILGS